MKSILLFLCLFATANVLAQTGREAELMKIISEQDSIPRNVFLTFSDADSMRLQSTNWRQVWSSHSRINHIGQLYDIRLKFKNHKDALAFYKKYLKENSEEGLEIKQHTVVAKDAEEFRIFGASAEVDKMTKMFNLPTQMFCYLFVVDNYFVKVYVSCNIKYEPNKFQPLITDIIQKIKK
jgi:hypothetical protein